MVEGVPQHRRSCFPGCEASRPAGQLGLPTLWPPARAVSKLPGFWEKHSVVTPRRLAASLQAPIQGVTQSGIHRLL